MNRTFWIGVYPGLGHQHLDYVLETLHEYFKTAKVADKVESQG